MHTPYKIPQPTGGGPNHGTFRWLAPNLLKLNTKNKITSGDVVIQSHTWRCVLVRLGESESDAPLSVFVERKEGHADTWAQCEIKLYANDDSLLFSDDVVAVKWHRFDEANKTVGFRGVVPWSVISSPHALRPGEKSESLMVEWSITITGDEPPSVDTILPLPIPLPNVNLEQPVEKIKSTFAWGSSALSSFGSSLVNRISTTTTAIPGLLGTATTEAASNNNSFCEVPWEVVPNSWRANGESWNGLVSLLVTDPNTYLCGPDRTLSHEDKAKLESCGLSVSWLDMNTSGIIPTSLPEALLSNSHVARLRFELVPKKISEDFFWIAFFWKVRELSRIPQGPGQKEKAKVVLSILNNAARREARAQLESLVQQCVEAARLLSDVVTESPRGGTKDIQRSARDSCNSMLKSLRAAYQRYNNGTIDEDLEFKIETAVQFAEDALSAKPKESIAAKENDDVVSQVPTPIQGTSTSTTQDDVDPDKWTQEEPSSELETTSAGNNTSTVVDTSKPAPTANDAGVATTTTSPVTVPKKTLSNVGQQDQKGSVSPMISSQPPVPLSPVGNSSSNIVRMPWEED
eukprot:PhF_6_TR35402/c0_g1_i1/m.51492